MGLKKMIIINKTLSLKFHLTILYLSFEYKKEGKYTILALLKSTKHIVYCI